ncbi:MAG: galactosylceramidase [Verrucomicrobiota bacterium]
MKLSKGEIKSDLSVVQMARAMVCGSLVSLCAAAVADQTVEVKGDAGGKRFDGIGAVSGGGATSVLLKDYPEPQRGQVLDLLFKPKFAASMSALYVEIPGDGSTQGTEPSHMHSRGDENYYRGYEWWMMSEAKKRNPAITLDGVAWSCPGWVGNGSFWSQDMCDYYVKWIQGLKSEHGLVLDAIGCRNEKGVSEDFIKDFKATLNANGLGAVKLHGFDNWQKNKFDWVRDMAKDPVLKDAVDVVGNHTMVDNPTPADVRKMLEQMGKPIWNTEEHVYKEDNFDCEISVVQALNKNFIDSGVTKIVTWFILGSLYPIQPLPETPSVIVAHEPWSGNYHPREVLWAYAHYGQFSQLGWQYLNGACGNLAGGGTYVTLKSPGADYSVIAETKGARAAQKVTFDISGGLSTGKLCVWRSNEGGQFVRLEDIAPIVKHLGEGTLTITLDPMSIYSISTTTGQQKGSFADIPASKPFPFPYYDNFKGYKSAKAWGFLPHYLTDISGVFELAGRPDNTGHCLRQVISQKPQSWSVEWMPYTVLGDKNWTDYEVSADIRLDNGGWAGVMGRVNNLGSGTVSLPKGYYLRLSDDGTCALFAATQARGASPAGSQLAGGKAANVAGNQWHNVKLRFSGTTINGFVDDVQVLTVSDTRFASGMAGLVTGGENNARNTAFFDNLIVNTVGGPKPPPTVFPQNANPLYNP